MKIEIVAEDGLSKWQGFVDRSPNAGPHHHSGWFNVLKECFTVTPFYYQAVNETGDIVGILPMYLSHSLFTGKHLTTMENGVLCSDSEVADMLYKKAIELRDSLGAKYLLVRGSMTPKLSNGTEIKTVRTLLPLQHNQDELWLKLSSNTRRKIRKAEKNGFSVEENLEGIECFYKVYARNVRDLGTPVMGECMMTSMLKHLREHIRLFNVKYRDEIVGGMFIILNSGICTSLYVAVQRNLLSLYPTYLLYWIAIKKLSESTLPIFDLGRSIPESGNHRFKQQWGGTDQEVIYKRLYSYDRSNHFNIKDPYPLKSRKQKLWALLPLRIANCLGPFLRKQLPFG